MTGYEALEILRGIGSDGEHLPQRQGRLKERTSLFLLLLQSLQA